MGEAPREAEIQQGGLEGGPFRSKGELMAERKYDTAQLEAWLDKWQPRLKLSDWDIDIKYCDIGELKGDMARIEWDDGNQIAEISVLPEDQYQTNKGMILYDAEVSIVHELVHLRLSDIEPKEGYHEERAVNAIAQALVYTDRMVVEEAKNEMERIRSALSDVVAMGDEIVSYAKAEVNDSGQVVITITPVNKIDCTSPPVDLKDIIKVVNFER
jgi:hypothetical protein